MPSANTVRALSDSSYFSGFTMGGLLYARRSACVPRYYWILRPLGRIIGIHEYRIPVSAITHMLLCLRFIYIDLIIAQATKFAFAPCTALGDRLGVGVWGEAELYTSMPSRQVCRRKSSAMITPTRRRHDEVMERWSLTMEPLLTQSQRPPCSVEAAIGHRTPASDSIGRTVARLGCRSIGP